MCGIFAMLSDSEDVAPYLFKGLQILQNRGYDSAGIATTYNDQLIVKKCASQTNLTALDLLHEELDKIKGSIGIAHTRWATHGVKNDTNAHPHIDFHQKFALVHNGIIENYQEIKQFLLDHQYKFNSETDTEVIVNLISYYAENKLISVQDAIQQALNKLSGTWGLAIMALSDPNHLYLCKKGSPLLMAQSDHFVMIASESFAFSHYVSQYIALDDRDVIRVGIDEPLESILKYKLYEIPQTDIPDLGTYAHWMLKEIYEQPETILRAINNGGRIESDLGVKLGGLINHASELSRIKNLIILACGTSLHAGLFGAHFFRKLHCFNCVRVVDAAEFSLDDIPLEFPGVLVLSQSGETKDVHRAIELIRSNVCIGECIIIGVVNVVDSLISRDSDCGVYLNAGREIAVASTKSFSSQCVVLILIALWFSKNTLKNKLIIHDLRTVHLKCKYLIDSLDKISIKIIEALSKARHVFILGRDVYHPMALEGALKMKEISYLHAEGYPGGALKHGPFALIELGTPVILLMDSRDEKMKIVAEEVKARGADVTIISNDSMADIIIPDAGLLTPILSVIPLQYMSYQIALKCDYNPDYPRNLAKVVTVD